MKVLFVCLGNACRSQMAESIARKVGADVMEAFSAGVTPLGFVPIETTDTIVKNGYSAPCTRLSRQRAAAVPGQRAAAVPRR